MRSALYSGSLTHHRIGDIEHRFGYRVAMPLIDLDEVEQLCALHPLWSYEHHNLMSFRRRDYYGDPTRPLSDEIRRLVHERLGVRPTGPISMLGQVRTLGWLFNPIVFYYCYASPGTDIDAVVMDVTNTPWHDSHAYVVAGTGHHRFAKELHVSPFFDMDHEYDVAIDAPSDRLHVRFSNEQSGRRVFDAHLSLQRRDADRAGITEMLRHHAFATMGVSARIHTQASKLLRKGVPFRPNPKRYARPAEYTPTTERETAAATGPKP